MLLSNGTVVMATDRPVSRPGAWTVTPGFGTSFRDGVRRVGGRRCQPSRKRPIPGHPKGDRLPSDWRAGRPTARRRSRRWRRVPIAVSYTHLRAHETVLDLV